MAILFLYIFLTFLLVLLFIFVVYFDNIAEKLKKKWKYIHLNRFSKKKCYIYVNITIFLRDFILK